MVVVVGVGVVEEMMLLMMVAGMDVPTVLLVVRGVEAAVVLLVMVVLGVVDCPVLL